MTNVPASAAFFAAVRPLFGGKLNQGQVDGLKADLLAWDKYGDGDDCKLAYILATDKLESAHTMQAVKETYNRKYDGDTQPDDAKVKRRLDDALRKGRIKRNYWRDGWFGRGKPQVTHKDNYARLGELIGLDLVANPDLLLDLTVSSEAMVRAMMAGIFTGKKLGDYITATKTDYVGARAVVNGSDRADEIAEDAETFHSAILAARQAKNQADTDDLLRRVEEELRKPAQPLPETEEPTPATETPADPDLPRTDDPDGPDGWRPDWFKVGVAVAVLLALAAFIF